MRLSWILLASLPLALTACDSDGDGLTNQEEKELGTNPDLIDSDGDRVSDPMELEMGTDPTVADTDGDGLNDGEELTAGTDPLATDSDMDGFSDPEELDDGTDPLDEYSYARDNDGRWPDLSSRATEDTLEGFEIGQRFPNVTMADQFGGEVDLYQYWGHVVMINMSTEWCGPCRTIAGQSQSFYEQYADDGFTMIYFLAQDRSKQPPSTSVLKDNWADAYGITFPVLNAYDFQAEMSSSGILRGWPSAVLLDREMTVRHRHGTESGHPNVIKQHVPTLLAE